MHTKTKQPDLETETVVWAAVNEWMLAHGGGPAAFTISQFCKRNNVSRARLYTLWRQGRGPRVMRTHPSGKVTITVSAEADWQREMEATSERESVPDGPARSQTPPVARRRGGTCD